MAYEDRISVRVPKRCSKLKARLTAAAEVVGVDESDIVLAAVLAACECVERHGGITFPIKIDNSIDGHKQPAR